MSFGYPNGFSDNYNASPNVHNKDMLCGNICYLSFSIENNSGNVTVYKNLCNQVKREIEKRLITMLIECVIYKQLSLVDGIKRSVL